MLVSYDAALQRILSALEPLAPTIQRLDDCFGRVLAQDIVAPIDTPPFDNSAMDGYAVRAADTIGASDKAPVRLAVIGEIAAGIPDSQILVGQGQAARIFTGGVVPSGADTIVPIEDTMNSEPGNVAVILSRRAERLCAAGSRRHAPGRCRPADGHAAAGLRNRASGLARRGRAGRAPGTARRADRHRQRVGRATAQRASGKRADLQ